MGAIESVCYGGLPAFMSECQDFVAVRWGRDVWELDVFDRHGNVWRSQRYVATGWNDTDQRYLFAEFPKMVTAYGGIGRRMKSGRWSEDFNLTICDCDQSVRRDEVGSTSNRQAIVFRRRVPPRRPRKWVKKILDVFYEPNR